MLRIILFFAQSHHLCFGKAFLFSKCYKCFRIRFFEVIICLTGHNKMYRIGIVVSGRSAVTGVRLSQLSRLSD